MAISSESSSNFHLINLKRLAFILKSLDISELETLEILMDNDAIDIIGQSGHECDEGKGIPIDQW
ncbi:MAG: hypothetical protein BWY45_03021 [Euryarchaeota archaeon ADurb.Bin294]|jgi:hypothetical protein|nr:MAG: hypothetical protein BWY45_03021 [Euryarchaeota archaeon ADurb.Bin294]